VVIWLVETENMCGTSSKCGVCGVLPAVEVIPIGTLYAEAMRTSSEIQNPKSEKVSKRTYPEHGDELDAPRKVTDPAWRP
jgi:hypothetical protein